MAAYSNSNGDSTGESGSSLSERASQTSEFREVHARALEIAKSMGAGSIEEFAYDPDLVTQWINENPDEAFPAFPADVERALARQVANAFMSGMLSASLELEEAWSQFEDSDLPFPNAS